ncbi:MAG: NifB/NifX family molybdenum-iron cluster-binding protein [Halothiobacillaceae bacterium]
MKSSQLIAITSQNRKTVTGHAGRCRKFWLYPVENGQIGERRLVELALEDTFHGGGRGMPPGLEDINVFISQGMGEGMVHRLQRQGVEAWVTKETEPDMALRAYLRGEPSGEAETHEHEHTHD